MAMPYIHSRNAKVLVRSIQLKADAKDRLPQPGVLTLPKSSSVVVAEQSRSVLRSFVRQVK